MSEILIPRGWNKEIVGDVIKPISLSKKKIKNQNYQKAGKIPIIDQGKKLIGGYTDNLHCKIKVEKPLIIFGDHTKSIKYVDFDFAPGADGIKVFYPDDKIIPKYLYYFLKSIKLENLGYSRHFKLLKKEIIVFPEDKKIQASIVQKLDYILAELQEKEKKIQLDKSQELKKILEYTKSFLLEKAFLGKLTIDWRKVHPNQTSLTLLNEIQQKRRKEMDDMNKKKKSNKKNSKYDEIEIIGTNKYVPTWTDVRLGNLIYIAGRIGWKGLKREEYVDEGPLFLSVHSLNYGDIVDFSKAFHIPQWRYDESPEIQLKENDILLTKDGAGIGKIGIVSGLKELATVNSSLLVIRSGDAFIPKFLFYFLKGPAMQRIVKARISGDRIPHLFQRDIKNFVLSIPPLSEQKEIVKIIEIKLNLFKRLEDISKILLGTYQEKERYLNNLSNVILNSAFSGKLVN